MEFPISDQCGVCKLQFNKFEIDFAQHCDLSAEAAMLGSSSHRTIFTHEHTDTWTDGQDSRQPVRRG